MNFANHSMSACSVVFLVAALSACGGDSSADMGALDSGPVDSGTDAGPTDSGAVDMGPTAATCATYCAANLAACTGANVQYDSMANCMAECTAFAWPAGMPGATDGNSLECRVYHTTAAVAMPGMHCPHAGYTGGGVCGATCEDYCQMDMAVCGSQASPPFASMGDCMTACAAFAPTGMIGDMTGNTLQCRFYHLSVAAQSASMAMTHCGHTGISSLPCM